MSDNLTPIDSKAGVSPGRSVFWRVVEIAVLVGITLGVVAILQGEDLLVSDPFYARATIGPIDRILVLAWLLGISFMALSNFFVARGRFPRTDGYYPGQLGFMLCVMSGLGFLFRLFMISARYG